GATVTSAGDVGVLVGEQQPDGVDEVLAVDLVDLQLGQQEVGGVEAVGVLVETPGEVEAVAHREGSDQDGGPAPGLGVLEEHPLGAGRGVEPLVGQVAGGGHGGGRLPRRLRRYDDVEVAVPAFEGGRYRPVVVQGDPHTAQEPDPQVRRRLDEPATFGDDV